QPGPGRGVSVVDLEAIAAVNNLLARGTRPGFAVPAGGVRGHGGGAQGHAEVFDRFGKAAADDVPVDLVAAALAHAGVGDPLDRVGHLVGVHAGDVLAIRIADVHPDRVGAFLHAEVAGRARGAMSSEIGVFVHPLVVRIALDVLAGDEREVDAAARQILEVVLDLGGDVDAAVSIQFGIDVEGVEPGLLLRVGGQRGGRDAKHEEYRGEDPAHGARAHPLCRHQLPPPPPPTPPPENPPPENPDPPLVPGVAPLIAARSAAACSPARLEANAAACVELTTAPPASPPVYQVGTVVHRPWAASSSNSATQRSTIPNTIAYGR